MKKQIMLILVLVLLVPCVFPLENCEGTMTKKDIPCEIISSFSYPDPCNSYSVLIFDSTPTLIGQRTMTNYGVDNRCNSTFNFTGVGSYLFNISNDGDTGHFHIVQESGRMIALILGLMVIGVFFGIMGFLAQGEGLGKTAMRIFGYGVALMQIVNIAFVLWVNETGGSLDTLLKANFWAMAILGFAIGMVALIHLTSKMINPSNAGMMDENAEEDKKW